MSKNRALLRGVYFAIAALALVACWRQNMSFFAERNLGPLEGFFAFWPALMANRATVSITVDIFLFGLAATIWMVLEARRLGMRYIWLYVVLSFAIAVSVLFPIFLAMREKKLAETGNGVTGVTATTSDLAGLLLVGVPLVLFAFYTLAM